MKKNHFGGLLNAFFYLVAFLLIQMVVMVLVGSIGYVLKGDSWSVALQHVFDGTLAADGKLMIVVSGVSSVLTILLFALCRWSPFSRVYLRSRPWAVLAWVFVLTFGTVIPSEWMLEQMDIDMPEQAKHMFESIMSEPLGYVAVGILAPLAEEMVFRGAILRVLLRVFDRRWHWLPIVLSALLFGAVHGNLAQFVHATLLGLLLGWMYYRTDSIVPGVVLHWVNNSVAYVMSNLLPQSNEMSLQELLGGEERSVWIALGCSLCILLPSLFQLALRMKRPKEAR